jgi:hypothetical protein
MTKKDLRYLLEKCHRVEADIASGCDMGAMGHLNPNLVILLDEIKKLSEFKNHD